MRCFPRFVFAIFCFFAKTKINALLTSQRGEQSGSGTYTYANQAVYDGVWENGRKHGSGYFSSEGQLLLELWCRGVRVKRCEVTGTPKADLPEAMTFVKFMEWEYSERERNTAGFRGPRYVIDDL